MDRIKDLAGGSKTLRTSPCLKAAQQKEAAVSKDKRNWKERRKRLRLPEQTQDEVANDEDYAPDGDVPDDDYNADDFEPEENHDDVQHIPKKKRRRAARAEVPEPTCAEVPEPSRAEVLESRKGEYSTRHSPSKFASLLSAISDRQDLKDMITEKGFGGLLQFKPTSLDRTLFLWLMQRFNPEEMVLEVGGGKVIHITEHTVWCIFQLPRTRHDPVECDESICASSRNEVAQQIYGKVQKILPKDIEMKLKDKSLSGNLALRCFLMHLFCTVLFSNTDNYIRVVDAKWTEDLESIGQINWCKAVCENLWRAGRLFRTEKRGKSLPPVTGCGIFLTILYLDHLHYTLPLDPFLLPRCAVFDSKTIDKIAVSDLRGVQHGSVEYGHIKLKSIVDTCYNVIPQAPAPALAAPRAAVPASDPVESTSHDMVASASRFLQNPGLYTYPSLSISFGQTIDQLLGRSKNKEEVHKIMKEFDHQAADAQGLMRKAHSYTMMAHDKMAKAHHECYSAIQKLLSDACAEKVAAKNRKMARLRKDTSSAAAEEEEGPSSGGEDINGSGDEEEDGRNADCVQHGFTHFEGPSSEEDGRNEDDEVRNGDGAGTHSVAPPSIDVVEHGAIQSELQQEEMYTEPPLDGSLPNQTPPSDHHFDVDGLLCTPSSSEDDEDEDMRTPDHLRGGVSVGAICNMIDSGLHVSPQAIQEVGVPDVNASEDCPRSAGSGAGAGAGTTEGCQPQAEQPEAPDTNAGPKPAPGTVGSGVPDVNLPDQDQSNISSDDGNVGVGAGTTEGCQPHAEQPEAPDTNAGPITAATEHGDDGISKEDCANRGGKFKRTTHRVK